MRSFHLYAPFVAIMRGHMKLVHALIAKSLAEIILVAILAVTFYLSAFPPSFHGWGEVLPHNIAGWAVNQADPWERIEVQLFIDGKFVANATANQSRPDVVVAGWARDEWHGYSFPIPLLSSDLHWARVYALHSSRGGKQQTLQQVGDPILFRVDGAGETQKITRVID
jgi:hypothetical protein